MLLQRRFAVLSLISVAISILSACGGGGGGAAHTSPDGGGGASAPQTFSIGGTVVGLSAGASVVLNDNGSDSLTIGGNGAFRFNKTLSTGATYAVDISTQPGGEQCAVTAGSGTVAAANVDSIAVSCVPPTLQLFAGALGGNGNLDGDRNTARLSLPVDMARDANGNLYVVGLDHTVRKIDAAGNTTTLAGQYFLAGDADGKGAEARFAGLRSVAIGPDGAIYVVDGNAIRRISPDGEVSTFAGKQQENGSIDGPGTTARFASPSAIRLGPNGSLLVADGFSGLRSVDPTGTVSSLHLGGLLLSLAVDSAGVVHGGMMGEEDFSSSTGGIAHIDLVHSTVSRTLSGATIQGLAVGGDGKLYFDVFTFGSPGDGVDDSCIYSTAVSGHTYGVVAGQPLMTGYADGTGDQARLSNMSQFSTDSDGSILVADRLNSVIRRVTSNGVVTTIAGVARQQIPGPTSVRLDNPVTLATDPSGNVYVSTQDSLGEYIYTLAPDGSRSRLSGTGPGTGGAGFAADSAGSVYEVGSHSIIKLTYEAGGNASYFAGNDNFPGSADGTGTNAQFNYPNAIASDTQGNLYVVDKGNFNVRKVTSVGIVTTIAGMAGVSGSADGVGPAATFSDPSSVAVDSAGNVYVVDNNAIRRITSAGAVSTLAGTHVAGFADGPGTSAMFNTISQIAVGPSGTVYVADTMNQLVRKITADGNVTTLAGVPGHIGVTLGPLPATLTIPPASRSPTR